MATEDTWRFLPLGTFEHLQSANWADDNKTTGSHEICEAVNPIWERLEARARDNMITIDQASISALHFELATAVGAVEPGTFKGPETWTDYVEEMADNVGGVLDAIDIDQSGAWLLAELFWGRLPSLRLLTPWFFISAIHIREGLDPLALSMESLGRLLDDVSGSGPPHYDAESLRSNMGRYG